MFPTKTNWCVFFLPTNSYGNMGLQKCRQAQTCDWKLHLDICHKIYILHWIRCVGLYQDGRPVLWALDWLWWGVNWFSNMFICKVRVWRGARHTSHRTTPCFLFICWQIHELKLFLTHCCSSGGFGVVLYGKQTQLQLLVPFLPLCVTESNWGTIRQTGTSAETKTNTHTPVWIDHLICICNTVNLQSRYKGREHLSFLEKDDMIFLTNVFHKLKAKVLAMKPRK